MSKIGTDTIMDFPVEEYKERVQRARKLMSEKHIDALLVTDPYNYEYFSGQHPEYNHAMRRWFLVIPMDKDPYAVTYGRFLVTSNAWKVSLPTWVPNLRPYVDVPFTTSEVTDWGIKGIMNELGLSKGTIGTELGLYTKMGMSYNEFTQLQRDLPEARFVDAGSVLWGCRMIKTKREIETIRKACQIGTKSWHQVFEELRTGMSQEEVNKRFLTHYIQNGGGVGGHVLKGATGPESTFVKGDLLFIDGGPSYLGYQMDAARVAYFGTPSERLQTEHKKIWQVLDKMLEATRSGVKCAGLFNLANNELSRLGLPTIEPVKRLGHGLGLTSEPPSINSVDQTLLQEGMVITPEPRVVTKDGIDNAEEHILVTKNGYENFSKDLRRDLVSIK